MMTAVVSNSSCSEACDDGGHDRWLDHWRVEAALMTRRSRGRHLGWRRLIWPALATMVCLALVLSAIVLAAPAFAIAAILAAGTIGACFAYQPSGSG
jgi:hypothetical protein